MESAAFSQPRVKGLRSADAAMHYLRAGWQPLPLKARTKEPRGMGWQRRTLDPNDICTEFRDGDNVGIKCGAPSGGLIDVDIDDDIALQRFSHWLPSTPMRHGRASARDSHRWYRVDDPECKTEQFRDPKNRSMLIEIRGTGGQTMVPPSVHPDGEVLDWVGEVRPAEIALQEVRRTVHLVAAAALLARHWPQEGSRNAAALALTGALLRAGMSEERTAELVERIAEAGEDEEACERAQTARATAKKLKDGEATTGLTKLKELVGAEVAEAVFKWLREANEIQEAVTWEEPILFEQLLPNDVPADLIPGALGDFAKAVAEAAEVPEALPLFTALGAMAIAAARCFVVMPVDGWLEHLNIYAAVALPPANNKSFVVRQCTKPLVSWEEQQRTELRPKIVEAVSKRKTEEKFIENKRRAAAKEDDPILRLGLTDEIAQLEAQLTEIPALPRLFTNDATPEALAISVAEQGNHFAIVSDEGGIMETLAGLYSNGAANTDILTKGIDGGELRVRRKDRDIDLRPILTLLLAIQPQILLNMAEKRAFQGNGLLDRFLFVVPPSKLGYRSLDGPPVPDQVARAYYELISRLLAHRRDKANDGKQAYAVLVLSAEALKTWQEFRARVELELRPEGRLRETRGWGGKLPGFVLRLAGLIYLATNTLDEAHRTVDVSSMERAIALGEHLIEHRLAAQTLMGGDQATDDAKVLYEWILREGRATFTRTECLRPHHGRFTAKRRLDDAMGVLLERRIVVRRLPTDTTGRVGRPAERYDVNPLVLERKVVRC